MLQLMLQSMTLLVRFGYFDYGQTFHVACARGWFDLPDLSIEVVCLPQSSGGYAVAKLDQGDLDIAVLGSTPWAEAISRGIDLHAFYLAHIIGDSQGLVTHHAITTPLDLHGETIATPFGSTAHQHMLFLKTIFPSVSLDLVDQPCNEAVLRPLMESGEIDGAYCWGPAFNWLKSYGKGLLTARTLARWGVETFSIFAARADLASTQPVLLAHIAGVMAALDDSWLTGLDQKWHPTVAPGGAMGYLSSVGDVIDTSATVEDPYVTTPASRLAVRAELELFEPIALSTQLSCRWLKCSTGTAGVVDASALASTFLHGQKRLASLFPPGLSSVIGAFSGAIDFTPLLSASSPSLPPLPNSTERLFASRGERDAVFAIRGASGQDSTCAASQALVASLTVATFGDADGDGLANRSYSDGLSCVWTIGLPLGSPPTARIRLQLTSARVWPGDVLTVHTDGSDGPALLAKIVGAPQGAPSWPLLEGALQAPLIIRFTTDERAETFYNSPMEASENGDGFRAAYSVVSSGCATSADCSGFECDTSVGLCICGAGRGGADCSYQHCLGTQRYETSEPYGSGVLASTVGLGTSSHPYDNNAECVFIVSGVQITTQDVRFTVRERYATHPFMCQAAISC